MRKHVLTAMVFLRGGSVSGRAKILICDLEFILRWYIKRSEGFEVIFKEVLVRVKILILILTLFRGVW